MAAVISGSSSQASLLEANSDPGLQHPRTCGGPFLTHPSRIRTPLGTHLHDLGQRAAIKLVLAGGGGEVSRCQGAQHGPVLDLRIALLLEESALVPIFLRSATRDGLGWSGA